MWRLGASLLDSTFPCKKKKKKQKKNQNLSPSPPPPNINQKYCRLNASRRLCGALKNLDQFELFLLNCRSCWLIQLLNDSVKYRGQSMTRRVLEYSRVNFRYHHMYANKHIENGTNTMYSFLKICNVQQNLSDASQKL
eukprot:TRINITY_DN5633_c1_g1_i6.p1 TRINITY_DN5633_c1_g1~~TRINITY_DN5633_c1_g1_i6.p1  ORF type:complete len:138 (-),score=10.46 TRINITY_DN5633_c1_g1_i6:337-750(-)